jgi:hypothetical protein
MEWYKTLSLNQRINLKDCTTMICGIEWRLLISLFGFQQTIELLHEKLKLEGFNV